MATSAQILEAMSPSGFRSIFVIGTFDARITFFAQQSRALELIAALFHTGRLNAGAGCKLGVIGGGAAGITAAYAAAQKGCSVICYEKRQLFSIQSKSNRYLHPNIYDWPDHNSDNPDAGLPFLNWRADTAAEVIKQLRYEVRQYTNSHPERLRVVVKRLDNVEQLASGMVRVSTYDQSVNETFDVVVIAIGFGLEPDRFGCNTEPYWNNDALEGNSPDDDENILISGTGDGGLIDVARAVFSNFDHAHLIKHVVNCKDLRTIANSIKEIDSKYQHGIGTPHVLFQEYKGIVIPPKAIEYVKKRSRPDRRVTLNAKTDDVLSLGAYNNNIDKILLIAMRRSAGHP